MYFLSNFCHLCLNEDKSLIDLTKTTPENEAVRAKLEVCISEVKWTESKQLVLCKLCLQKLEVFYDFKQTCIKSIGVLNKHLTILRGNKSKPVKAKLNIKLQREVFSDDMIKKYIKSQIKTHQHGMLEKMLDQTVYTPTTSFILANGQQVSYQNIFLNFVSTNSLPPSNTNQLFVNLGNQKLPDNTDNDIILKQLLEAKNPEEVSVEIDPSAYEHFLVPKPIPTPNIECSVCLTSFTTIKLLRKHIFDVHDGIFPYSCTYCFSKFLLKDHYDKHMKNHIDNSGDTLVGSTINLDNIQVSNCRISGNNIQNEYKCRFCAKMWDTATNLEKHEHTVHNVEKQPKTHYVNKRVKSIVCKICSHEFSTKSSLDQHMKSHYSEDTKLINTASINKGEAKIQAFNEQNEENENLKTMPVIDREPDNVDNGTNIKLISENIENNNLEVNNESSDNGNSMNPSLNDAVLNNYIIESGDGKPVCSFCNKTFGRKYDLKRHINNLHIKSIQYVCHLCSEKFYEGFHLTRHLRNHYSSLSCSDCHHIFPGIPEITNHMLTTHNQLKSVDCNVCYSSFDDMSILKGHIDFHLSEIVYKCQFCEKDFAECRELTKHVSDHIGIKTCENCSLVCYSEEEFANHKTVCVEEIHKCDVCPRVFKKKRYLQAHFRARHSVEMCGDEPQKKKCKTDVIYID